MPVAVRLSPGRPIEPTKDNGVIQVNTTPRGVPAPPAVRLDLGGRWSCRAVAGPVPDELARALADGFPGTVPGVVHLDLLAAGLIDDPYDGRNEHDLTWIGRTDWEYSREFEWHDDEHSTLELVAEGLDTIACVRLNGVEAGRSANHHRSYRFDVADLLRRGTNEIRILFTGALEHAEAREAVLGARPHSNDHPFNCIRKPAYSFGWDWGPEIVTAGIWRPISLEARATARLTGVRPLTSWSQASGAALDLRLDVVGQGAGHTVRVDVAGLASASAPVGPGTRMELEVPGAEPWWPRSHGAQPRYETTVSLLDATGQLVDTWTGRIGFRSVSVDTTPDETGTRFQVAVNGAPVHVRGANWIPADTYLPRVDRASLLRALTDAAEANMNLVRVWGGGIYETDEFYDVCDELGLLVWQDFTLACAAYSEAPELWDEIEAEAREAITRLSAHPSLAIWNGGNENIWGWADWGWRAALEGATWGEGYYTRLFPGLVDELAPGTPYLEGSPFSFDRYLHPNSDLDGSMHIWDVWNTHDYTTYRDYRPRFVSEFGFQGPPAMTTLESVVRDEPRSPYGPQMLSHQKATDGNLKLERGLGDHLPVQEDYVDWHWATQLNQARAIRFGIEHFRSLSPFNTGSVVWQLNDCWPVISWSAVDGLGLRKPLWFALRAAFADRLATLQPRDGDPALVLHNETHLQWHSTATLRRMTLQGQELATAVLDVEVRARGAVTLALPEALVHPEDPTREFVVAELGTGERALWYFVEDTALALGGDDAFEATAEARDDGYLVTVRARELVKDLTLLADQAHRDASVDEALVTLLPGETVELRVRCAEQITAEALVARPVLRTANDLVARDRSASLGTVGTWIGRSPVGVEPARQEMLTGRLES
ncbi:glycoside hydrolase family 2 protein [Tessaracoccus rhinocerotis]|uniref:beta-mannosidase n=1 Tax=Tessaracoccus rhinocerotis TaxID=1689449 RepID=A0A553JWE7_9ACTN|nr:glycoside hydrolase family 2 protein [Tessaracoccus rhinocerotis]